MKIWVKDRVTQASINLRIQWDVVWSLRKLNNAGKISRKWKFKFLARRKKRGMLKLFVSCYSILHNPTPPHLFISPILPCTKWWQTTPIFRNDCRVNFLGNTNTLPGKNLTRRNTFINLTMSSWEDTKFLIRDLQGFCNS